jgi:uncharacterized damage-inducible protein DinB
VDPHPLVTQLRFARSEFVRGLGGVTDDDGVRRVEPMNSIGWIVGHLANQEHRYWVRLAQGRDIAPGLNDRVGTGRPASAPPLDEMWATWSTVTAAADAYLDTLTTSMLTTFFERNGRPVGESVGTLLLRNIYHYWFHAGEAAAIRQVLGHTDLPEFVGDMTASAYRPEGGG